MKRLHLFLFLSIASLFAIGCERDEMDNGGEKTFNSFRVEMPAMRTDNKAYVDFAAEISQILYEDGDVIYVNHQPFTLHKTSDHWVAEAATAVSAEVFYCCHASGGEVSQPAGVDDDDPLYQVKFSANSTAATGLVLAGSTTSNVLTFENPPFAVLVLKDPSNAYSSVKVGFDGGIIPRNFTVSASDLSFPDISSFYFDASSSNPNSLLTMKKPASKNYFYIAVPLNDDFKKTKLYLQYETPNGTQQRVTSGQVELRRGHVYVLPSEDMSEYPFDVDGASRYKYSVSATTQVRFSAGNLQFNPRLYTWNQSNEKSWRFATYQYDQVEVSANVPLASTKNSYMDLFAWGTSGLDNGGLNPWERDNNNGNYGEGADDLGDLDWGHVNTLSGDKHGIYYGNRRTTLTWRTLTKDEWFYLINSRPGKVGFALLMNEVYGMIILPDNWTLPDGLSFSPSDLNTYSTYEAWRKMEKNGAIFLPACGYRTSPLATSITEVPEVNNYGRYWSSTHDEDEYAFFLKFDCSWKTKVIESEERKVGMSVRLVTENGVSTAQ